MQGWDEKRPPKRTALTTCEANAGRAKSKLPGLAPACPAVRAGIACRQGVGVSAQGAVCCLPQSARPEGLVASFPPSPFFKIVVKI